MRVLHLIDAFGLYGAEKIVLDLMDYQNRQGWQTLLGSIGGRAGQARPFESAAVRRGLVVRKFPMQRGVNLAGGWDILNYAKRAKVDVIHSHSYKGNIIVGLFPRFLRAVPFAVTLHGWRPPHKLLLRFMQCVERLGITRADQVVAVHPVLAQDKRLSRLSSSRLQVICNGIPPAEYQDIDDDTLSKRIASFTERRFAIAAVGRLSPEKGFGLLIRAVGELCGKGFDCALTIFGDGEQRHWLSNTISELGLNDKVLMPGYVPQPLRYRSAFDCLVIPSFAEACPLVALEGMQAGVPVVASTAGGLPHLLDHGRCGRLFSVGDIAKLKAAILAVQGDSSGTQTQIAAGRKQVRAKYTAERMGREYVQLYQEIAAPNE